MSLEEEKNKALARRSWESVAMGDLDAIDELLAPDFVDHSLLAGQKPGREGYKRQVAEQHAALSDIRPIIEDQLAKGDKVVTRLTWRSIHDRGEYFGLMPRDKEVVVTAMSMHRIVGGMIAEEWSEDNGAAEVAQAHLELLQRVAEDRSFRNPRCHQLKLPASAAGEEPVGDEGYQRHEHDRPEHSGEQQREQDPQHSERSEASTKASSAKAQPANNQ